MEQFTSETKFIPLALPRLLNKLELSFFGNRIKTGITLRTTWLPFPCFVRTFVYLNPEMGHARHAANVSETIADREREGRRKRRGGDQLAKFGGLSLKIALT